MMYKTQTEVLKAACFRNPVNKVIHTLYQSKFFTYWVPTSHSENDVNLAIRAKIIISNILFSIPVTHENNLHINCLCPFFLFAQWTQWHTVMIYRLLFAKVRQQHERCFQVSTIFLHFFLCQISCTNFRVDRMFQASAQTLFDIGFRPN
jgi:hypothetical protein